MAAEVDLGASGAPYVPVPSGGGRRPRALPEVRDPLNHGPDRDMLEHVAVSDMTKHALRLKHYLFSFFLIVSLCCFHAAFYLSYLPRSVPSHFSSNGSITSEVDKAQLINTYMGVVFGLGSLFFCMAFFLPACFSCVSLPDAQYHLSTARRAYTLAAIGKMFLCQGSLTIVFAAVTYQLQFAAADSARDSIDAGFFWLAFFAYLVAIIATVVFLVKRFNKVKRAHQLYQRSLTPLGESR